MSQVACRRLSDGSYVKVDHVDGTRNFRVLVGSVEDIEDIPVDRQQVVWRFTVQATQQDMLDLVHDLSRCAVMAERQTASQIAQLESSKHDAERRLVEAKRPI